MAANLNSAILDSAILHRINFTHSFWLNLMMAAIFNSANLNSTILDSTILVFILKLTHTCQDWFPPFAESRLTHLFWLNLMITAILNSAMLNCHGILDSDTLLSSLRFTTLCRKLIQLTQTHFILTQLDDGFSHLEFCHLPRLVPTICRKKTHSFILTQLDDQAILNSAMLNSDTWHLGFRHLVIFSQIHSKSLSLHPESE